MVQEETDKVRRPFMTSRLAVGRTEGDDRTKPTVEPMLDALLWKLEAEALVQTKSLNETPEEDTRRW